LDGTVESKLFFTLSSPCRLVPKFLLVATDPDLFRSRGWSGIVDGVLPGYKLERIGLNEVAVSKMKKE